MRAALFYYLTLLPFAFSEAACLLPFCFRLLTMSSPTSTRCGVSSEVKTMTTDALARRSFALALFALLLTLAATARAQGETWIPAPPESAVPLQLAAFDCADQAGVN